jgi:hypothetical protein
MDSLERLAKQARQFMKEMTKRLELRDLWMRLLIQELDRQKREKLKH